MARFGVGIAAVAVVVFCTALLLVATAPGILPRHDAAVITSDSMAPGIRTGDVVVTRAVPPDVELPRGTVVLHRPLDAPRLRLHRISDIDDAGHYVTKGDANAVDDGEATPPERIVGAGIAVVPAIGRPVLWLDAGRYGAVAAVLLAAGLVLWCSRYGWLERFEPARLLTAPPCADCERLAQLLGAPPPECYHRTCDACDRLTVLLDAAVECHHTPDDLADPTVHRRRVRPLVPALAHARPAVALIILALAVTPASAAFTTRTANAGNALGSNRILAPTSFTATAVCKPAPTFRSSSSSFAGLNSALVVSRPAGVQAGDVLLAGIAVDTDASTPNVSGFTHLGSVNTTGSGSQHLYWKIAGASEPASYTLGGTSAGDPVFANGAAGIVLAYSGASSAAIEAYGGQSGSNSNSVTAPSVTTGRGNTMLVGFFGAGRNGTFTTTPMTKRQEQSGSVLKGANESGTVFAAADETRTSAGATGTRTATHSATSGSIAWWGAQLVALRPIDPDAQLTWTPTTSTIATGYLLTRSGQTDVNIADRLTSSRTEGPLLHGVAYTWNLRAVRSGTTWRSPLTSASLTPNC